MRLKYYFQKWFYFEYWPGWLFYIPILPYWFYLGIRGGHLGYFVYTNPGFKFGGLVGQDKDIVLMHISEEYKPKQTLYDSDKISLDLFLDSFRLNFPVIVKPNLGERGTGVAKKYNKSDLHSYLSQSDETILIQEFICFKEEFGVFYTKAPSENKGKISSITQKKFLSVIGNGKDTVEELMKKNLRSALQIKRFKQEKPEILKEVIAFGEEKTLEEIGNHCKGTEFLDANHLLTPQLVLTFEKIAKTIPDFYYGRFDIKAKSIESFQQGKDIMIMEVNGANSEPTHMYDQKYNYFNAMRFVAKHWKRGYLIAKENEKTYKVPHFGFFKIYRTLKAYNGNNRPKEF